MLLHLLTDLKRVGSQNTQPKVAQAEVIGSTIGVVRQLQNSLCLHSQVTLAAMHNMDLKSR